MLRTLSFTLYVVSLTLSIVSVIFGVISWILLKKWRQFRHFAFISFIMAGANFLTWMHVWAQFDMLSFEFLTTTFIIIITHIQMSHWQLITTVMIYTALVDVFSNVRIKCKYVLVCSFSWVLPIIETYLMVFALDEWATTWFIVSIIELSILVANLVLYVRVVYSLVRLVMTQKISVRDVCGKVLVSTLACATSGVPPIVGTIVLMCVAEYGPVSLLRPELAILPNLLNVLLANVLFLSMKSHRLLWKEYIHRVRDARATRLELEMQLPRNEANAG